MNENSMRRTSAHSEGDKEWFGDSQIRFLDREFSEAKKHHRLVLKATQSALDHAWRAGRWLNAAKKQVPPGTWLRTCAERFKPYSIRTAQTYMQIAQRWGEVEKN